MSTTDTSPNLTDELQVVNPTAVKFGEASYALAPRLERLDGGVTLGLLWNGKNNGNVALQHAAELIQERVPDLEVKFYSGSQPCPPTLLNEISRECDVVMACTAD